MADTPMKARARELALKHMKGPEYEYWIDAVAAILEALTVSEREKRQFAAQVLREILEKVTTSGDVYFIDEAEDRIAALEAE